MRTMMLLVAGVLVAGLTGCDRGELDTRTFELHYINANEASRLVAPYVYTDRERAPGMAEASRTAITVRETPDNLDRIARMLAQFDRPQPAVMLHFQIIRADGASDADPAIADVERELRRLFRFDGYQLLAETRVGGVQNTMIRQVARGGGEEFLIESHVQNVRSHAESQTVGLHVTLSTGEVSGALQTQVAIPAGHAVVLGTAQTRDAGALILVVRADVAEGAAP